MVIIIICSGHTTKGQGSFEPPNGAVYVDIRDGVLTATFADMADDAALRTAAPSLIRTGVRSVSLRGAPVRDIAPLSTITGLTVLDLSGSQVRDLTPLAGLIDLRTLNLQFLRTGDLRPLAGLVELRTLNFEGTDVSDLTPLAGLTELRDLNAAVTRVSDLTPIMRLRQLSSLNLGSTWVADIRPLAGMVNLRFLSLNGTPVDDVEPLAGLVKMQMLDLGGTQVGEIRALAGMRELRSLNLEGTSVADVSPLAGLTALQSVALGGSRVRDVASLAHLLAPSSARPPQPEPDPVLAWNEETNRAIQATSTDAFEASRALAAESVAVHDTIKSIDGTPAFLVRLTPPGDVSVNTAVAAAAHAVLTHLFPTRRAVLDAALASALAHEPVGASRARTIAFGDAVAAAVIMLRDADGSMAAPATSLAVDKPGGWQPTPPGFLPPVHTTWGKIRPFALLRPDQFRPAQPPAPETEAFRQARAEVASLGELHSRTRTPEQTEIAHYWSDAIGTYAPAGHWNAIATNFVAPLRLGISVEAELFAELNIALADAGIAIADAKYTYWVARPVTAIRSGSDGVPPIPDWKPLLETPNHPSFISGHSGFSGAAATVLTTWFGSHPFSFSSPDIPSVTRHFTSFQQAAEEAAMSRLYGGIHFAFDNREGIALGRAVGAWTMAMFEAIGQDRGPVVMMMDGLMPAANADPHAFVGCALDNLYPVTAVTVRLDNSAPFIVPVDDRGIFTLPTERLSAPGHHAALLTATSVTGRSSMTRVQID